MAIFGQLLTVHVGAVEIAEGADEAQTIETQGLIDTGASDVCIDYRLATDLGLRAINQTTVSVVGSSVMATIYMGRIIVPEIGFDRIMPLYALRLRQATHAVLLGRSFLQNYVVTFNGPAGMFQFASPPDFHQYGAIEDDYAT